MTTRVYVPRDAAALALGADAVASLLRQAGDVEVVRTGSRGLFWLEPMVEVATAEGRIAYGPVTVADISGLLGAGMLAGGAHPLRLGRPEELPFLAKQTRLTFARCGIVDPLSLDDYRAHGGLKGLARAREIGPAATIEMVTQSGLRGRGGAGFPTGIKWKTAADAQGRAQVHRLQCGRGRFRHVRRSHADGRRSVRADRGHGDRRLRGRCDQGLRLYALGISARDRHVRRGARCRAARRPARRALRHRAAGRRRRLCVRRGDLAARQPGGQARPGARQAAAAGAQGPVRHADGDQQRHLAGQRADHPGPRAPEFYREIGMGRSRGTMPIQLAGNIKYGGLFECGFGVTLGELVNDIGGGTLSGRPVRAVQVGGPLGAYFPPALFDTPFDYEAFAARDGLIGHGGIVVFDDTVDLAKQARFAMEFCAEESCGKCTPCRIGSVRGMEVIDRIIAGEQPEANLELLRDLCHTMKFGSLCALGGFIPYPVMSALEHFPEDFRPCAARPRNDAARAVGCRRMTASVHSMRIHAPDSGTRLRHAGKSRRPNTVTLTIDGQEVTVPDGTSIMRAAMEAGIKRPETLRHRLAGQLRLLPRVPGARSRAAPARRPPAPRWSRRA